MASQTAPFIVWIGHKKSGVSKKDIFLLRKKIAKCGQPQTMTDAALAMLIACNRLFAPKRAINRRSPVRA